MRRKSMEQNPVLEMCNKVIEMIEKFDDKYDDELIKIYARNNELNITIRRSFYESFIENFKRYFENVSYSVTDAESINYYTIKVLFEEKLNEARE